MRKQVINADLNGARDSGSGIVAETLLRWNYDEWR